MTKTFTVTADQPSVTRSDRDLPHRAYLLDEAKRLTTGDRNVDYGPPRENMAHIARIFNAITGRDLSPTEIPIIHMATKLARMMQSPTKDDHYVDLAAYAGITAECAHYEAVAGAEDDE